MAFQRIAIIGTGLIGSSVARAVRSFLPEVTLSVYDGSEQTRELARKLEIANTVSETAAKAVQDAELVVLAVPIPALEAVAREIAPHLADGALVTDVSSVKQLLGELVEPLLPDSVTLVPAHPIAGSEQSGIEAGSALLLAGKRVILTPTEPEHSEVVRVAEFWKALQMSIVYMPPELHDRVYACVSHLPQYLAFAVRAVMQGRDIPAIKDENFQHFVRLQRSDPELWLGIFKANKDNLSNQLNKYLQLIHQISTELGTGVPPQERAKEPATNLELFGEMFPYLVATALVAIVQLEEQEMGVPLKEFAGTGFSSFIHPVMTDPDVILERISSHSGQMAPLLHDFVTILSEKRYLS